MARIRQFSFETTTKFVLLSLLLIIHCRFCNLAFGDDNWLLDQRRCIGFSQNATGQIVRLSEMQRGTLLMDIMGPAPQYMSVFQPDQKIGWDIDGKSQGDLQSSEMPGWYVVGPTSAMLKKLSEGHRLSLYSVDKSRVVEISLDGVEKVKTFLEKCHL